MFLPLLFASTFFTTLSMLYNIVLFSLFSDFFGKNKNKNSNFSLFFSFVACMVHPFFFCSDKVSYMYKRFFSVNSPLSKEKTIMHISKRYYMIKAFYTKRLSSKRFENGERTTVGSATEGLGLGLGIPLCKNQGKIEFPI